MIDLVSRYPVATALIALVIAWIMVGSVEIPH